MQVVVSLCYGKQFVLFYPSSIRITITVESYFFCWPNGQTQTKTGDIVYEVRNGVVTKISGDAVYTSWSSSGGSALTQVQARANVVNIVVEPL